MNADDFVAIAEDLRMGFVWADGHYHYCSAVDLLPVEGIYLLLLQLAMESTITRTFTYEGSIFMLTFSPVVEITSTDSLALFAVSASFEAESSDFFNPVITTPESTISEITYSVTITSIQTSIPSATPTNLSSPGNSGVSRNALIGAITGVVGFFVLLSLGFLAFWLRYTKRNVRKSNASGQQDHLDEPVVQNTITGYGRQHFDHGQIVNESVTFGPQDAEVKDSLGCYTTNTSELAIADNRHELHQHGAGLKPGQDCYELPGSEVRWKPGLRLTEFWRRRSF